MWAKVLSQVLIKLATSLAGWLWNKTVKALARRKKHNELKEVAQKVEDAKSHDEVRAAADDLP